MPTLWHQRPTTAPGWGGGGHWKMIDLGFRGTVLEGTDMISAISID
jgi:hypothetical protein